MSPASRSVLQVAGVIAGACFLWWYAILPRLGWQSLASMTGEALFYVVIAWICGGIITFCVYQVVSLADLPDVVRFSVRSSAPAMWFAPALILLSVPMFAAFAVSLTIIVNATRLLVAEWVSGEPALDTVAPWRDTGGEEDGFLSRGWLFVLMGSFTAQASIVAMLWRHPLLAAACLATSAAILTSLAIVTGAYQPGKAPSLPPSLLSIAVTFLLAAALSFSGIVVRRGGWATTGTATNAATDSGGQPAASIVTRAVAPPEESAEVGGGFPGVILLPPVKSHTTLVVPPPATPRMAGVAFTHPVGIAFSGEYWMFKPPRRRPPLRSIIRRGKPSELAFHTVDGATMEMEAHQAMDPPVDIACCRTIQLVITNTDRYPGSVWLELILVQSEASGGRWESLGKVAADSSASIEQTLSYQVPPGIALHTFDEFKVVFHRSVIRADKSARIAIERFVLVP